MVDKSEKWSFIYQFIFFIVEYFEIQKYIETFITVSNYYKS